MFGCRTQFLAPLLLIFAHYTHTFVLLTANIEDVKKIARKFVSEPLAEQIAQFIARASGQAAGSNVSAENEQNAGDVQNVSENELEQLSKVPRQKYETKKEINRYKQLSRSVTPKMPAKIEYVEDKSDTTNHPNEPLIQYKKNKEPMPFGLYDYKKREPKPKFEDLTEKSKEKTKAEPKRDPKEEPKEELEQLLRDETTTRQQKRWKKKESGVERAKQDRPKKSLTTKRHRPRKKTDKELNFDDDGLPFQLLHHNENDTNNNKRQTDIPSSDLTYTNKNNDKYNREIKIHDKSTFRQHDRDSREHDYTSKFNERHQSRFKSRYALKSIDEPHMDAPMVDPMDAPMEAPVEAPRDAPMYAPIDVPVDDPIEDPMEINFNRAKVLETTKGNDFIEISPIFNAFNIGAGAPVSVRKSDNKRKGLAIATSGNLILPIISEPEQTQYRRGGS